MTTWLGTIAAERALENRRSPATQAGLRIGVPRERRTGDFECRYEIRGFGKIRRTKVYGVDSVQALTLAVLAVRHDLARMDDATWEGMPAYLTLPIVTGACLPKKFVDRLERAVERVHAAFYREARKRAPRSN